MVGSSDSGGSSSSSSSSSSIVVEVVIESLSLLCDNRIPKGQWVLFSPYVMGRLESLWPNALEFNPERFLGEGPKPSPYVFTAFQV